MRTRTLAAPLIALAALPLAAGATSAAASTGAVHFDDSRDDAATSVDLTRVVVSEAGPADGRVKFQVRFAGPQESGDHTAIYVDTDRTDRGPELRLAGARDSEYWFETVESWNDRGAPADCDFYRMRQGRATMTAVVDRDCIGDGRVRFEVRTTAIEDGSTDWLGRARSFNPFIPHP